MTLWYGRYLVKEDSLRWAIVYAYMVILEHCDKGGGRKSEETKYLSVYITMSLVLTSLVLNCQVLVYLSTRLFFRGWKEESAAQPTSYVTTDPKNIFPPGAPLLRDQKPTRARIFQK